MTALIDVVEINEVAIGTLGPALWCTVDLIWKLRHPTGKEMSAIFWAAALKIAFLFPQ
jgi:hypothetical protein